MDAENIGPEHKEYDRKHPGFTQVIVRNSKGVKIVQFVGPRAKINAQVYMGYFRGKE